MEKFNVYVYGHGQLVSAAVAATQPEAGGCKTESESAAIIFVASSHETLAAAIAAAKKEVADAAEDFYTTREYTGANAARSGRTHSGAAILYRVTAENDAEYDYDDCE